VKTLLIDEKGCKKGAEMHPFAPSLVTLKFVQLFWNEWRGRRDSERLPLLIRCNLLIPRTARTDKNATKAEPRYTAGTRDRAAMLCALSPLEGACA